MRLLRRPVLVLAPAAAVVVAVAMLTNVLPFRHIYEQRHEVATARLQLEELEAANRSLEAQVAGLHTPLEVERLAREQLGYVRPGEHAFVVIDPPQPEQTPAAGLEAMEGMAADASPAWYERVWHFLTGRDLASG